LPEPGGRLVLVVEDNPTNLMLVTAVLRRAGYATTAAGSADEARRELTRATPSLILMDVQLPGQDGLSLAGQLKTDPATCAIPIVALTAHAMDEHRQRALAAGCDGYIAKPINTRTFVDELEAVLSGRSNGGTSS
jgi:two-component system cell cycle response regulator DivK